MSDGVEAFFGFSRGVLAILVGVILVVGVAIGLVAFSLFGGPAGERVAGRTSGTGGQSSSGGGGGGGGGAPCTDLPQVSVTSVSLDQSGFRMTASLSSTCDDDEVVSGSSVQVLGSVGSRDFVSGTFDLASDPIVIPGGQRVQRTFVFPLRAYWRIPELLGGDTMQVELRGARPSSATGADSDGSDTLTASAPAAPAHGDPESVALGALQEIAAYDYPFVKSNLADWWIPQIGSKKLGIVAEGKVFTNAEMLFDHLAYRTRYEDVRLASSGQWTTFSGPGFWVTVVGRVWPNPEGANGWCDANGIDAFNCFAKVISDNRGPSGTMVLRH